MYPIRDFFDRMISWIYVRRLYGSRCPDYDEWCWCCRQWKNHDDLFDNR